jgi:hypothetical protein
VCKLAPLNECILAGPLSPANALGASPPICSSLTAFFVAVRLFRSLFGASGPEATTSGSLSLAGRLRRSFGSGAGVGRGLSISCTLLPTGRGGGAL